MCGGAFVYAADAIEQPGKNKNDAKNPAEPVCSGGVFSILNYPDSFVAFQWHYAMSEINKT